MPELTWRGKRKPEEDCNQVLMSVDYEKWANLPLYLEEENHASEFNWGYWGSGAAQLAYAILRTHFEIIGEYTPEMANHLAITYHQDFKVEFVSSWKTDEWELSSWEIENWLYGEDEK
jgi:hypothetical protein